MSKTINRVRCGRLVTAVEYTTPMPGDRPRHRAQKQKASTEAREMLNAKASYQKLERVLAANFDTGDLLVTLTYDNDHIPDSKPVALQRVRRFLYKLRCLRKVSGASLLYVYVTEQQTDNKRRLHHHIVCNATGNDVADITSCWSFGSQVDVKLLQFDAMHTYEDLARYLTKEPREYGSPRVGERTWTPSLGLKKPEMETETVPNDVSIALPPGAYMLASVGPVVNGYGEFRWIKYLLPEDAVIETPKPPPRRRRRTKRKRK